MPNLNICVCQAINNIENKPTADDDCFVETCEMLPVNTLVCEYDSNPGQMGGGLPILGNALALNQPVKQLPKLSWKMPACDEHTKVMMGG